MDDGRLWGRTMSRGLVLLLFFENPMTLKAAENATDRYDSAKLAETDVAAAVCRAQTLAAVLPSCVSCRLSVIRDLSRQK